MAAHQALDPQVAGQQVRDALAAVRDPEMGRPVTELGFVDSVSIDGGRVHVHLRLPTYFRATHLTWLMLADARAAIGALPWVASVEACLRGQHGMGQPAATPAATADDARRRAWRAAFLSRQHELIAALLDHGFRRAELCHLRLGDLPVAPALAVYLQRRAAFGLDVGASAPLLVTEDGAEVPDHDIDAYLAVLREFAAGEGVRAGACRNPLQTRHRRHR